MDPTEVVVTGNIAVDTHWYGRSPKGAHYSMQVRPGTSDWNTANACAYGNDEYGMAAREGLEGWALDIGAHIGAWIVPTLIDNPGLRGVCVEALTENVDMLIHNLERNGLRERCYFLQRAAGGDMRIGYPDDEQHRFIGNARGGGHSRYVDVPGVDIAYLLNYPGPHGFRIAKIDCEGCEYPFLSSPDVAAIQTIVGEVHEGWARLVSILSTTHAVSGPGTDFGPFLAERLPNVRNPVEA